MKKLISFILAVSLGLANVAFAGESKLDKESSEFLFGNAEVDVITLSEQEMRETKGEFGLFGTLALIRDIHKPIRLW